MKATIFVGLNCVTLDSPIGDKHNSPNVINSHPITKVKNGICSPPPISLILYPKNKNPIANKVNPNPNLIGVFGFFFIESSLLHSIANGIAKIIIINDDILKIEEKNLYKEKFIVFGNLPYNISTEILSKWILNLDDKNFWFDSLILMFQKEVADRIISKFNSSKYGRLSILTNWKLENGRKARNVGTFHPKCILNLLEKSILKYLSFHHNKLYH